jgi:protein TonB
MEMNQLVRADILDILFDGRNKDYGAYELRKTYNQRLVQALFMTAGLCILFFGTYLPAARFGYAKPVLSPDKGIYDLTDIPLIKNQKVEVLPRPRLSQPQIRQAKAISIAPPRILPDDEIDPKERPQENADAPDARIGNTNTPETGAFGDGGPGQGGSGAGPNEITGVSEESKKDIIFTKVEIESTYPEGSEAWRRFLIKNFRYPEAADGAQGTVIVQFIVDREGNVSNVEAISGPMELREEAVRVIRKSGKWTPAIQNGAKVASYKKQPIVIMTQQDQ